ncbi:MAG: glycosyltransferase family 2 protein [Balneolaceae bacterium]|nr:glycosyltransferase family 2 protein [Balneolaceae bacterium]
MHSFSVIIVSWNALDHLKTFIPSVTETDYPDFEIILADNASSDGSAEWVSRQFPKVRIIRLEKNYGYCGGNNRAAKYADGEILVFLNNDVKVEPDWLHRANETLQRHRGAAVVQPKMLSYEEPHFFEYAGAAGGYLDKHGFPFCKGRIFDHLEKDEGQYDFEQQLMWASGAAMFIRQEIFARFDGFDEDFEFHMEEIDLCWRIWNRGYTVYSSPSSVVYHLGGGSLPMGSPRKTYYNYRNSLRMLWKNYTTSSLFTHLPIRIKLDFIAMVKHLLSGKIGLAAAIVRAYLHFLGGFRTTHRKRQICQQHRTIDHNPDKMLPISIVWQYFIRGKKRFSDIVNEKADA